jgi:hypothetical protein
MVTDFTPCGLFEFFKKSLLIFLNGRQTSPIVCFGSNREFLEYMTHNTIRGGYVS